MTLASLTAVLWLTGVTAQEPEKKDEPKPEETKPAADGKLDLKWSLEAGKPFFQKMTTTTVQNLKVMGMDVSQTNVQEFFFKWEPIEEKDGNWTIKQSIEGVRMKIDIAGNPISFDSTAANTADSALAQFFEALKGSTFTFTLDNKFNVVGDIEGLDEFVEKLTKANSRMEKLLTRILSQDSLKAMVKPTFGMVTDSPKDKGESWGTAPVELDLGPIGVFNNKYDYTYAGKGTDEANKNLDKVDVKVTVSYAKPSENREGLPFQIRDAKLESDGDNTGVIYYDPEAKRVVSSSLKVDLKGTLTLDIGGMTTEVALQQSQTTEMETKDTSYIAPGN